MGTGGIDIERWASDVATREAARTRVAVREALLGGRGVEAALHEVRRRLHRLTPAQREALVRRIGSAAPTR
ncbi:hypothetical protein [Miltoncostaea marina]|uniref:hypothetical protein n=1 Tax=Miltoncostaea marina TaxID=2843215 RepID=UPI001C3DC5DE|nr:hypothetical protein [Miltoncostaea marina]